MWQYNYTYSPELYHHGVKGMKWGVRKKAKDEYKSAVKARKEAYKELNKKAWKSFGVKGLAEYNKAEKNYTKADMNAVTAKAKYKAAKAKNEEKAKKAEFNTYVKEMKKTGLAGSGLDRSTGGRSTSLYNSVTKEKGKKYADAVQKKVQNKLITDAVIGAAATVGAGIVAGILAAKGYDY